MTKNILFKQEKPLKGKILSEIILCVAAAFLFFATEPLQTRIIFFVCMVLINGFSVSYRIKENFENKKVFAIFGLPFFKTKLSVAFPDYISVFSASFSLDNEWGTIAAIGTQERQESVVIRFFTGNKHFTLYKTENYERALQMANELGEMLDVEVHDATKE